MNWKTLTYCCFVSAGLLSCAGVVKAQETPPPAFVLLQGLGPEGGRGFPFGEKIELLGFEGMHGGKVVTGAPFSAVAVSETTQTLSDGTHISRKTQVNLYRDSQGRFRKEVTLSGIGPLDASGKPKSFVIIHDPVAGTGFMLEPATKVAHTMPGTSNGGVGGHRGAVGERTAKDAADSSTKTEDLGKQVIGGISAQGTRYTRAIPIGEMGNDKALTIVSEKWISPELQITVMSKHTDPLSGTTTYTVTNIQQQEPAAALFTVPADYTLQQGGPGKHMRVRPGAALPPPEN
jgi:hypothetical protein